MLLKIPNKTARRIFLDRHGLLKRPSGGVTSSELVSLIKDTGFVQVDSINTIARAHDMILYARRNNYRVGKLKKPLEKDRTLFEHWTHDASIIPTDYFPYWRLKFARDKARLRAKYRDWHGPEFEKKFDAVLDRIAQDGRVCSAEVGSDEKRSSGGWWEWHPSKTALEYLWRSGDLSVCRRVGFRKYYDLTERVIPKHVRSVESEPEEVIDWACSSALDRLGFATSGELAAYWALISPTEAKYWCAQMLGNGVLQEVEIELADGSLRKSFAWAELDVDQDHVVNDRVRVLSPFDPALRDRKRAQRLFGFDYKIEIFVPAPKRKYGYYVFPVLEGDKLIGRIDASCSGGSKALDVVAFWPEKNARLGKGRQRRLEQELDRIAKFVGAEDVAFASDWLK